MPADPRVVPHYSPHGTALHTTRPPCGTALQQTPGPPLSRLAPHWTWTCGEPHPHLLERMRPKEAQGGRCHYRDAPALDQFEQLTWLQIAGLPHWGVIV